MENNNEALQEKVVTAAEAAPEAAPEVTEASAKKPLPWWIFAIIGGVVVAVVAVVLVIVLGCWNHIDKDDDFLCDKCGAECDDGLEIVYKEMTLTFKDEAGAAMAGVKLTLVRGNTYEYDVAADANGVATVTLPVGSYNIEYDYTTIPSGFQPDVAVLRVAEDSAPVSVTVVDNNPNGSKERPYLVSDNLVDISVAAGAEVFYTCRVADSRKMKVTGDGIVVIYKDTEYASGEEFVIVNESSDVSFLTMFSVKNTTASAIDAKIETVFDPGTLENPYATEGNTITVHLAAGQTVYYKWSSDVDCLLIASKSNNNSSVLLSKVKIVEEQEIPVTSETDDDDNQCLNAFIGEEIIISITNESKNAIDVTVTLTEKLGE